MPQEQRREEDKGEMSVREAGQIGGREVQHQRDLRDQKQVRGQAYDKPGPPEGTAYGIAAVTQALEGLEFPATKEDVLKKAGNQRIHFRKNRQINLRQVIEATDVEEFPSMANIVQAVSDSLKEEGITGQREAA